MKTKIKISRKLRRFLNEKGVLEQFIYNCEHCSRTGEDGRVRTIDNGFTWINTKEGGRFWCELSNEFDSI